MVLGDKLFSLFSLSIEKVHIGRLFVSYQTFFSIQNLFRISLGFGELGIGDKSSQNLITVQEPHPQPPPRKQGGGYYIPYVIKKRYIYLVTYHLSPVTCHLSPITYHLSPVTYHLSPVTCHLSPVTCHLSPIP
ncbi:hypothetical protein [Nostoc sp. UHCC 0870]|uniref:hypothetical protein n=1 Tax=Nostoc sp. UHCC 0870 TaxID=2914041 RepID=UPI001EDFAB2F|nr:hypothetical protein [Nostoc sp. UHCC 0870]UKP00024.1 hypothetical protein L6494_10120 [Nostoc sp. UHCC 0870]